MITHSLKALRIDCHRLMADIYALSEFGRGERGITRGSFSTAYQEATDWLVTRMKEAGLQTRVDAVGNVIGRMGPTEGPIVMSGSHIDTVREGGPLDGSLGVLAGIEVARIISENNVMLSCPYEVVAFVDEEGEYLSMLGSMAITGELTHQQLVDAKSVSGKPLLKAMKECGLQSSDYQSAAYVSGSIGKFIELHIEQGPVLETEGLDIGVVDGVVCQRNIDYCFSGQSNHAGTTPMDMRKDAFRAAAEFLTEAYALLDDPSNINSSTRMTFGTCVLIPGSSNVIPRECKVRMDNRDLNNSNSDLLAEKVAAVAHSVAHKHRVHVEIEEKPFSSAELMAPQLSDSMATCCRELGYSFRRMPSGAGHDAQLLALVCDAGMIFVPSINGLSHHPDEWTAPKQLETGANVLLHALLRELM